MKKRDSPLKKRMFQISSSYQDSLSAQGPEVLFKIRFKLLWRFILVTRWSVTFQNFQFHRQFKIGPSQKNRFLTFSLQPKCANENFLSTKFCLPIPKSNKEGNVFRPKKKVVENPFNILFSQLIVSNLTILKWSYLAFCWKKSCLELFL